MTNAGEAFREKYGVQGIAIALILLGLGIAFGTGLPWREVARTLGDGVLIAGILALAVDPFLKKQLLHEASRGIFKHMLGFDHEPEVKNRLEEIVFKTKLYARDRRIHCKIEPLETDTSKVRLTVTQSWSVDNPTAKAISYPVGLAFEQSERPSKATVKTLVKNGQGRETAEFAADPDEPGIIRTKGDPIEVPPGNDVVSVETVCVLENQPNDFHHDFVTAMPLIDVTVTVEAPDNFAIRTSRGFSESTERMWRYRKLFMPDEKVTVRWFPKTELNANAQR